MLDHIPRSWYTDAFNWWIGPPITLQALLFDVMGNSEHRYLLQETNSRKGFYFAWFYILCAEALCKIYIPLNLHREQFFELSSKMMNMLRKITLTLLPSDCLEHLCAAATALRGAVCAGMITESISGYRWALWIT